MTLIQQIQDIYKLLADDQLRDLGLFNIEGNKLITPIVDDKSPAQGLTSGTWPVGFRILLKPTEAPNR